MLPPLPAGYNEPVHCGKEAAVTATLHGWLQSTTAMFQSLGPWGLALLSFAEASFFPVPPDLVLIPLVLANPRLALWYATIATASSTAGGLFGYWLGRRVGRSLLRRFASEEQIGRIAMMFQRYGGWAVLTAALTPIPYKVFTIAAGLFLVSLSTFTGASIVGRGLRFYLEAVLLWLYGPSMVQFLQGPFGWVTVLVTVAVAALYWFAHRAGLVSRAVGWLRQVWRKFRTREPAWLLSTIGRFGAYLAVGLTLDAFFLVIVAKLATDLREHELASFDSALTAVARAFHPDWWTGVMRGFTFLGSPGSVIFLGAALGAWLWWGRRLRWGALLLEVDLVGAWLLSEILKDIFRRPRPEVLRLAEAAGYSFPSGHSTVSFAFYGFLSFLLWQIARYNRPAPSRRGLVAASAVASLLVLLIGWSRVYLGVHYPTDVIAGFATGGLWATICAVIWAARPEVAPAPFPRLRHGDADD
ncbi:MAG: phosphatase PAP2 family protein [Symbiobacteriia bacterium]